MVVPDSVEAIRQRAELWLAAVDGELSLSAAGLSQVARAALMNLDPVGAASAYRSAEWAIRQRPDLLWMEDNPGILAYRLESSFARHPHSLRVSAHELLEESERHLFAGKVREAWLAALAAQRLAYDDVDPGNVHRARMMLASVWERTLEIGGDALGDAFSIHSALFYSALVHADLDDGPRARRADVLTRALAVYADDVRRSELVAGICTVAISRSERVGALALLTDLAPALAARELNQLVVPLLRMGFSDGWGTKLANGAQASCRLLTAVLDRLTPEALATMRDDLARLEAGTPAVFRTDLYVALAQTTDGAGPLLDGGESLARQLLATLNTLRPGPKGRSHTFRGDLGLALAAVSLQAAPGTRAEMLDELEREAADGYRQGLGIVAARGAEVPSQFLDDYLHQITDVMRGLTRPANPSVFGMPQGDDAWLTERAGVDASSEARHAAIDAAIGLLGEDQQREVVRAGWVFCAVRLAWGTPERCADIVAALLRIASGRFTPSNCEVPLTDHPLSGFRATGFHSGTLHGNALEAVGGLWAYSVASDQLRIRESLLAALLHADPAVRKGAVFGIRNTMTYAPGWEEASTPPTAGWQIEPLVLALADPRPEIQNAARESLVALVRPRERASWPPGAG
jgi:hypothetical protein